MPLVAGRLAAGPLLAVAGSRKNEDWGEGKGSRGSRRVKAWASPLC